MDGFADEVEGRGKVAVRILESDNLEPADIIHAVKFVRSTSLKGSAPNVDFAHPLDNWYEKGCAGFESRSGSYTSCTIVHIPRGEYDGVEEVPLARLYPRFRQESTCSEGSKV